MFSTVKRESKFTQWWDMTPSERKLVGFPPTLEEFAKANRLSVKQVHRWNQELCNTRQRPSDDLREFEAFMKVKAFEPNGTPQDRTNYMRLKGWLKNEAPDENKKYEFTSEDRLRIATEVIAGLRESHERDGGVCPVCGQSPLLSDQLRLHSEQDNGQEGEVGTVALPA